MCGAQMMFAVHCILGVLTVGSVECVTRDS